MKAVGFTDESLARPQIGIAHCWIGTMPCNWNHRQLAANVAEGVRAAGGTPLEVNTIAINDGITTGTEGMKTSLVSREIIADSVDSSRGATCLTALSPSQVVTRRFRRWRWRSDD
jgi:dihydroxy-acid dehydratase